MSILIGNPRTIDINLCSKGKSIPKVEKDDVFKQLKTILRSLNIKTKQLSREYIKQFEICSQMWARDYFVKIDNTYVLLPGNSDFNDGSIRKNEYKTVQHLFKNYIINNSVDSKLEGGDILQERNNIFIGHNTRTNLNGINFIKRKFTNKKIIPIKHSALHLDCCF